MPAKAIDPQRDAHAPMLVPSQHSRRAARTKSYVEAGTEECIPRTLRASLVARQPVYGACDHASAPAKVDLVTIACSTCGCRHESSRGGNASWGFASN
jgi:hypothetical protein